MKIIKICIVIFSLVSAIGLWLTAGGIAITLTIIGLVLTIGIGAALGFLYIYERLGKAKLANAEAFATMVEAAKVAENVQALATPMGVKLDICILPTRQSQLVAPSTNSLLTEQLNSNELPTAPSFSKLLYSGFTPSPVKMLLGYTSAGPLYGSIDSLLSTGVAGRPGQGKSSLLRFVYAQVAMLPGGQVYTLDPHGSITDDIRTGKGLLFDSGTAKEFDQAAQWIVAELDKRLNEYRKGKRDFNPIMGLIDEMPVVSLASQAAKSAIGKIILEGRKVKMYALISGQGLTADQFGGSLFRDALSSRYIFKTTEDQGRYAGLEKEARKLLAGLQTGRAVFDGAVVDKPSILAIPLVTAEDLSNLTPGPSRDFYNQPNATRGYSNNSQSSQGFAAGFEANSNQSYNPNNANVVTAQYRELLPAAPSELERFARAYKQAGSLRAVAALLNITYYQAQRLYQQAKNDGLVD